MSKFDIYEAVTERIIAEMEKGIIPWHKPWFGTQEGAWSRTTGRPYSFINQMLLGKSGEYLTFKQVVAEGGKIKKGSKAKMVVFYKPYPVKEKKEDGTIEEKTIPLLKYYNVFHIDDTEGVEPSKIEKKGSNNNPIEEAERLVENYKANNEGLKITNQKGDKACYRPLTDEIIVPEFEQFENEGEYYSTLFHEITHSTGTKSRCDRDLKGRFGTEDYSKEELIAEMGAASLMNIIEIETERTFKNSAAYVQNWLQVLKNDKRFIVSAAGKAEKAVEYILK